MKLVAIGLFFLPVLSFSQSKVQQVEIKHSNSLEYDPSLGTNAKRLIGSVELQQGDMHLFCDSAYFYSEKNIVDCFGNVHIIKGGGTDIRANFLKYNGNTRMAELHKGIRLTDNGSLLTTELLYYDMKSELATYTTGGIITSKENVLTSQIGHYNPKAKIFSFKNNVVLTNPQYVINSDTLIYNSGTNTSYFLGPTHITSTENKIYCEYGWYNTDKNTACFSKKASILSKGQKLTGDSILYDRDKGIGRSYGHVSLIDTSENLIVTGDYAIHYRNEGKSLVTGHAVMKQFDDGDTLYLHADTLRAVEERKITKKDTLTWKVMYAYRHVKFFRNDIQGKCDSLVYSQKDSLMRLFKKPVLWSEENQMTAEKVYIKTGNGEIKNLFLENAGMIISKKDTHMFDQIKGKKVTGFFKDNKLSRIFVEGNGQTIYFAKDKEKYIGINKAECSNLMIYIKENKVDRITFLKKPDATLFPMSEFVPSEFRLKDFIWRESERPLSMNDIFR